MPLDEVDRKRVEEAIRRGQADKSGTSILVLNAAKGQKLGPFTVACTILNRTIGSGIFVSPAIVLKATGSVGASLLIWVLAGILGMCGLMVWLELGMSIPKFELVNKVETKTARKGDRSMQCVPANGGEKNFLEYIYKSKKMRTTCIFGVIYIILGNLSGNAVVFGIYFCQMAGLTRIPGDQMAAIDGSDDRRHDPLVRGLAVLCLTIACAIHALWRKGGIWLINGLAIIKTLILVAVIVIGFAASAGASFGHGNVRGQTIDPVTDQPTSNFNPGVSFASARSDAAGYASAILFSSYSFGGYEQPFYVLGEVYRPKKYFAITTLLTQAFVVVLFVLVNIAYLCAVSVDQRLDESLDMATVFFRQVFGNEVAPRVMSGIIALSLFGNIVVMTFTASKVKQEIAKEGILPFSLFFAHSTDTPWVRLKRFVRPSRTSDDPPEQTPAAERPRTSDDPPEQTPAAALFLHWIFAMILVAATSPLIPRTAYTILVPLYSYCVVRILGVFVSTGLLYLRWFSSERDTWVESSGFRPWGGPTAAIIYTLISAFVLPGIFIPPAPDSISSYEHSRVYWYIVPTIGWGMLLLGLVYYLWFKHVYPKWFRDGKILEVDHDPTIVTEDGEYVQALVDVQHSWEPRSGPGSNWTGRDGAENGRRRIELVER